MEVIDQFTKERVFSTFKEQTKGKQFALLNFWSKNDCVTGLQSVEFSPSPQVDSSMPSMPLKRNYNNYIVARPSGKRQRKKHTERIEVEYLYLNYHVKNKGQSLACIYLYSFLMPCINCANTITTTLGSPPFQNIPVVVTYTEPYKESDATAMKILCENNIRVYQVNID